MNKKFGINILSAIMVGGIAIIINSCGKVKEFTPSIETSLFGKANTTGLYFVMEDGESEFKIPVGISAIPKQDRTVQFSLSSPTGAVEGQQYDLGINSITIPAGTTSADFSLKGIFAGYQGGRKDTLIFKITGGDIPAMASSSSYTVVVQQYCDVVMGDFTGTYQCQDYYNNAPDGPPYEVELTPGAVDPNGTSAKVSVLGLWGSPVPFNVDLDWKDPAAFKTSIATQSFLVHPVYGQSTIRPNGTGTFSSCDNTFRISYEVTVSAGTFGKYYSTLTKL